MREFQNNAGQCGRKQCGRGFLFSAVTLILTAITVFILLRDISAAELLAALAGARLRWLLGGFAFMLLYVVLEGVCIKLVMKTMEEPMPILNCVKYAFVGFYFSGITPSASGGQPAQIYCMGRDRFSVSKAALCLLLISSVYQISMLCYGAGVYAMQHRFLDPAVSRVGGLLALGAGLNFLLVAAILFLMFRPAELERAALWVIRRFGRRGPDRVKRREEKLRRLMADYAAGAAHIRNNRGMVAVLFGITFLRLTILYLMPWFVSLAFGIKENSVAQMIGLQAMLTLAVSSLPSPGSVGVSEGTSLLLFGMMFSSGLLVPAMLLLRGISFYGVLVASGLVTAAAAGESFAKSSCKR